MSLRIPAAFAIIYLVWGSTYYALRLVVESMPPLASAGLRFATAGLLLIALSRARGERLPTRRQWRSSAVVGLLLFLGGSGSVAWGQAAGVPSGTAALLVATVPLWMTLISHGFGDRAPRRAWIGLGVGLLGLAWLMRPESRLPSAAFVMLLGASAWALGSVLSRRLPGPGGTGMAAGAQMLIGGAALLVSGVATGELSAGLPTPPLSAVLAWIYLVLLGSVVGFATYSWLLRRVATEKVATYAYVNPIVAIAIGTVAGEPLLRDTVIAMLVVLGAVAWTITSRKPAPVRCRAIDPCTDLAARPPEPKPC